MLCYAMLRAGREVVVFVWRLIPFRKIGLGRLNVKSVANEAFEALLSRSIDYLD